jgi:hypothetical protein
MAGLALLTTWMTGLGSFGYLGCLLLTLDYLKALLTTWNGHHILFWKRKGSVEVFLIESQNPGPNVCRQVGLGLVKSFFNCWPKTVLNVHISIEILYYSQSTLLRV